MQRNFLVHLSDEKKERLKELAKASGMTMSQYAEAVLTEAVENEDLFVIEARKLAQAKEASETGSRMQLAPAG